MNRDFNGRVVCVAAALLCLAGCASRKMAIGGPENSIKGLPELVEALAVFEDRSSPTDRVSVAFASLAGLPVREKPDLWVRIANDESYRVEQRRMCLYALFKRHVRPGVSLSWFCQIPGTHRWFQEHTVIHAIAFQTIPVDLGHGEDLYDLAPEILRPVGGRITLRLSHNMTPRYLRMVLRGDLPGCGTKILKWVITERGKVECRSGSRRVRAP